MQQRCKNIFVYYTTTLSDCIASMRTLDIFLLIRLLTYLLTYLNTKTRNIKYFK